ncbi:MAG: Zn-dependent hydrolase [Candidatus Latescibacterota bacterium]|jgi:N-carbamoyl-L-amino-acid hydrolase
MAKAPPTINIERLRDDLQTLADIGKSEDHGIYRMAFTEADMEARSWLAGKIESAGMHAHLDGAANVIGRIGPADERPAVMIGSHLDTVPGAGHLDGALGIVVALEVLRAIHESNWTTEYPLEMVAFSDEEGRFGPPVGSRALVGDLTRADLYGAADLDGNLLVDVMADRGLEPEEALASRRTSESLHAYLELHIEQGPLLEQMNCPIGIVESFAGLFKWTVRLIGDADHAGTTPMNMREDAFMGLAEFAASIQRVLDENGSSDSVATIGRVELLPGSANTVPARAEFSLDVRDPDQEVLNELANALRRVLSAIARRRSLMFEFDVLSEIRPVACDEAVVKEIGAAVDEIGIKSHRMASGAIHDAQIMSRITRVGMIFVPSKDGRSHSPAEWTHWEDIEVGADVALQTIISLAQAKPKQ